MRAVRLTALVVPLALVASAAAGMAETATPSGKSEDQPRRICRVVDSSGSLAGRRRVCLTREDWDRSAEEHRRRGEDWVRGQDSCNQRAEGGTPITPGPGSTAAAMARMSGC